MMNFNPNADNVDAALEMFLRMIAKALETAEQPTPVSERWRNRAMPYVSDNRPKQAIPLQEFVQQVSIVLQDVFEGTIMQEKNNCLRIELPDNNTFRLQINKCGMFGDWL